MRLKIKLWAIVTAMLLVGCLDGQSQIVIDEDPPVINNPSDPSDPTPSPELILARSCVQGSFQNAIGYTYNYGGSQPLNITYIMSAFPLETTFDLSGGNDYFLGSSFNIQVVFHSSSGGDAELVNETIQDTYVANYSFDAFSTPMYMATDGDSFTVTISSDFVVTYDGVTQIYPHIVESIDFTLTTPAPSSQQFAVGEIHQYDPDLECGKYFNPLMAVSSSVSATPDEFDISVAGLMSTYPLNLFFNAANKTSMPVFFERSFEGIVRNTSGVSVGSFNISPSDISSSAYSIPVEDMSNSLPAGIYELELNSTVSVNFGSGMKNSSVRGTFEMEILPISGEVLIDGETTDSEKFIEFGLALFE